MCHENDRVNVASDQRKAGHQLRWPALKQRSVGKLVSRLGRLLVVGLMPVRCNVSEIGAGCGRILGGNE